jgi:hypothetical protein
MSKSPRSIHLQLPLAIVRQKDQIVLNPCTDLLAKRPLLFVRKKLDLSGQRLAGFSPLALAQLGVSRSADLAGAVRRTGRALTRRKKYQTVS